MAAADPTHLESECRAALAQTQAPGAVLEQASIPQLQVKPPQGDLCEMSDQARRLQLFLPGKQIGLTQELGRREGAKLFDEMGE